VRRANNSWPYKTASYEMLQRASELAESCEQERTIGFHERSSLFSWVLGSKDFDRVSIWCSVHRTKRRSTRFLNKKRFFFFFFFFLIKLLARFLPLQLVTNFCSSQLGTVTDSVQLADTTSFNSPNVVILRLVWLLRRNTNALSFQVTVL